MTNVMMYSSPTEELLGLFRDVVKEELSKLLENITVDNSSTKLYTRKEVAKKLNISLPTLNEWSKDGTIQAHRIGSCVRYKEESIEKALHAVKNYKYTRNREASR